MAFSDPAAAETAFYAAFERLDQDAMQGVWIDSDDASCVHPGGPLLQGKRSILRSWQDIFDEASPPRVEYRVVHRNADAKLAVHTVEERVSSGAGASRAVILATNVYVFTGDGWQMIAHHASLPLVESRDVPADRPQVH